MPLKQLASGVVHNVPGDLRLPLIPDGVAPEQWQGLTARAQRVDSRTNCQRKPQADRLLLSGQAVKYMQGRIEI